MGSERVHKTIEVAKRDSLDTLPFGTTLVHCDRTSNRHRRFTCTRTRSPYGLEMDTRSNNQREGSRRRHDRLGTAQYASTTSHAHFTN